MSRTMKQFFSLVLTLTLVLSLFNVVILAEDNEEKTITILATADLHNRLYSYEYATDTVDADAGLAKISTLIAQERALSDNILLMDCGDTVQDNSGELFNALDVHPMVQALNYLNYDVWTVGNHEFNYGLDFLNKNIAAFEGKVLAANIKVESTDEYFVSPYEIFEIDGVRVAVIGMVPPHIPVWEASTPNHFEDLVFEPVLDATQAAIDALDGNYDVLVGAYHIGPDGEHGYDGLEVVANNFPEFDVIFGAHSHAQYNKEINGVQIIEPGKYGWALAKANITVKSSTTGYDVQTVETSSLLTKELVGDPDFLDTFEFVHTTSLEEANRIVGKITADFITTPDFLTGDAKITTMPTSQLIDTPVIDFINEVQLFYTGADIGSAALFNFGSNLLAGDFKKKDVAFIYLYDNTLVGVNITGENLVKYMEWSADYYNTSKPGDLTVSFNPNVRGYNYDMFSGIDYKIDISKESGQRIINPMINGKPIESTKVYKLAVNNYRFGTIMNLGFIAAEDKYYDSYDALGDGGRIRDLIIRYTQEEKNGVITPSVDNNWELIGVDLNNSFLPKLKDLVLAGDISIPTSEDGRTLNVAALNLGDLIVEGLIPVEYYTIKSGDVLWKIARSFGTTWQELAELNHLSNPHLIFAGAKLMVPSN